MPRGRPRQTTIAEENTYILRQLEARVQIRDCMFDEAGWIAMKLAIPYETAQQKIVRALKGHDYGRQAS